MLGKLLSSCVLSVDIDQNRYTCARSPLFVSFFFLSFFLSFLTLTHALLFLVISSSSLSQVGASISNLLPALDAEWYGMEAIRLYIILPELWLMEKSPHLNDVIIPYAKAFTTH